MGAPEIVETSAQAAACERPPLLVLEPLRGLLEDAGIASGALVARRIGDGHSNVTYLLSAGATRLVLRRPPRPPLPPSAHDVLREARLLQALARTAVRTPRVLVTCADETLIGAPFYLMEEVVGAVLTKTLPNAIDTAAQRAAIGDQLIDALVELHDVDWRAAGLEDFGKAEGYLERQLRRFGGLWEHNRTRELPLVEEVARWLADNVPRSPAATIVHGDYRLGNAMFATSTPADLLAIFDWELATIGDPLADIGYLAATWAEPGEPADTMFAQLTPVTRLPGFSSRQGLADRYAQRSGHPVSNLHWYQALALWKAAIFMEGNYRRYLTGNSDDDYLATLDVGVPALAAQAREFTRDD